MKYEADTIQMQLMWKKNATQKPNYDNLYIA